MSCEKQKIKQLGGNPQRLRLHVSKNYVYNINFNILRFNRDMARPICEVYFISQFKLLMNTKG